MGTGNGVGGLGPGRVEKSDHTEKAQVALGVLSLRGRRRPV